MSNSNNKQPTPPTVITLTLPEQEEEARSGTLIIARGDLAHVRQFTYGNLSDLTAILKEGVVALARIEADPPKDTAKPAPTPRHDSKPEAKPDDEPTVEVPLKKGTLAVKISSLKLVGGETDAAAYRQAVLIAGKLIDGKLWDGKSPIRIDDVYAVQSRLGHLSERDLSMFALTDFVQIGEANTVPVDDDQPASDQANSAAEEEPIAATDPSDQTPLL
ncbi:MAG: hypothetical protein ABI700_01030 [Chloroflexota bacterium]